MSADSRVYIHFGRFGLACDGRFLFGRVRLRRSIRLCVYVCETAIQRPGSRDMLFPFPELRFLVLHFVNSETFVTIFDAVCNII